MKSAKRFLAMNDLDLWIWIRQYASNSQAGYYPEIRKQRCAAIAVAASRGFDKACWADGGRGVMFDALLGVERR